MAAAFARRTLAALAAAPPYSAEVVPLHGQPGPDSLLGHWLALVSKNRQLQLERAARKLRITSTEWVALRQLQRSGRTTQCRLATDAGLTAPSLSRALASLEERLGVALFHRARQRLSLAPAGHAFLPRAKAILAGLDEAALGLDRHLLAIRDVRRRFVILLQHP